MTNGENTQAQLLLASEQVKLAYQMMTSRSERLEAIGGSTSLLKDAGMRLGALNWGGFFQAQPDTPAKLAGFAYAFEHLEIGGYEQLKRVAQRADDSETMRTVDSILTEERAAAEKIAAKWEEAIDASLAQVVAA